MARFRVVSKHQVSGWRFLFHRIEHALVRRDPAMVDDPQQHQSGAMLTGLALAFVGVAGVAVLAFFKPAGVVGESPIVSDQDTGALYVHLGGRLYPALNLTSARLITGSATDPVRVSESELAKYSRGPVVGIVGAPGQMVGTTDRDSTWTVCDQAENGAAAPVDAQTGLPTAARLPVRDTVIGGPLTVTGDATRGLGDGEARLLYGGGTTWLVYRDPDGDFVRASIDMSSTAVTMALGLDPEAPVITASIGLIDAIPEAPALTVPDIEGKGLVVSLSSGLDEKVGSIVSVSDPEQGGADYYLVLQTGVVRVSPVVASMIRNADSEGSVSTETVAPDVITASLRPGALPVARTYPNRPVHLVDPTRLAVTCYSWSRSGSDAAAHTNLIVGRQLPLTPDQQAATVTLVTAQNSYGQTADAAYLPRTTGRFVQVTGADPNSDRRESLWWISDNGIRYGIDAHIGDAGAATDQTLTALNLGAPVPAPWNIVSLFAAGPTLSQRDARVEHEGVAPDPSVVGLTTTGPS
jgi:type VII secretion protein EccB